MNFFQWKNYEHFWRKLVFFLSKSSIFLRELGFMFAIRRAQRRKEPDRYLPINDSSCPFVYITSNEPHRADFCKSKKIAKIGEKKAGKRE